VAINDVGLLGLPLKAARCDAIANLKSFGAPEHRGFIYIHYEAPPHFAGIVIIASVCGRWVKIPVVLFRHLAQLCRVGNRHSI